MESVVLFILLSTFMSVSRANTGNPVTPSNETTTANISTTVVTTARPCSEKEFTCESTGSCLSINIKCNGIPNCEDGSDERNCHCDFGNFTISNVPPQNMRYPVYTELEFNCSFAKEGDHLRMIKQWSIDYYRVRFGTVVDGKIVLHFEYRTTDLPKGNRTTDLPTGYNMVFFVHVSVRNESFLIHASVQVTDINDPPSLPNPITGRVVEGILGIGWQYRLPISDPDSKYFPRPRRTIPIAVIGENKTLWGQYTVEAIGMPKEFRLIRHNETHTYLKLVEALDAEDPRWLTRNFLHIESLTEMSESKNFRSWELPEPPILYGNEYGGFLESIVKFTLKVTDGGGLSSIANVSITVQDINDNIPTCNNIEVVKAPKAAFNWSREGPTVIVNFTDMCHDHDISDERSLNYRFFGEQECQNGFQILNFGSYHSLVISHKLPPSKTKCTVSLAVFDREYASAFTFDVVFLECPTDTDSMNVTWRAGWPGRKTKLGNICPKGYYGDVYRFCDMNGVYRTPVYNCTNAELFDIERTLLKNASTVDSALSRLENSTKSLYIGDIYSATKILDLITNVINLQDVDIQQTSDNYLDVANNLMETSTKPLWRSIINETGSGANTVWTNIERFTEKLATYMYNSTETKELHYAKSTFYLSVVENSNCKSGISFPNRDSQNVPSWTKNTVDNLFIPCNEDTKDVSYSSCIYKDMRELIPARTETVNSTTFAEVLNSPVLALTLYQRKKIPLLEPVTLTFQLYEVVEDFDPKCSYWNSDSKSWAIDGCKMESYNKENGVVVCKCTHLTNFAILMSPSATPTSHTEALSIISLVGCITSMIFLVLTFGIYVYFWKFVAGERSVLLLNLCGALFLAYLVFLAGVDKVNKSDACTFVAVFLHYIYLVVFFIMLLNGLILAKTVLKPFNKTPVAKAGLLASYGIAAVIVGISMGASKLEGYGTNRFCWLSTRSGLIWAFIGPVILIILINVIVIVIVLRQMFSTAAMASKDAREKAKMGLRSVCVLMPIMGVTWILGIFSVNDDTVIFQYLFAICNSIQGLLIFIFHCIMNKKVKAAFQKTFKKSPTSFDTSSANKKTAGTSQTDV